MAQTPIQTQTVTSRGGAERLRGAYTPPEGSPQPINSRGLAGETLAVNAIDAAKLQILRIPALIPGLQSLANANQFTRQFSDPNGYQPDVEDGRSPLGTPVYGRIVLGDPEKDINEYTDAQNRKGKYLTVELDCALVNVDFNSQVVLTNIQGLPQTIKEFISSGDSDITITGIYNSTPGVAPMDFIMNLAAIFSAPVPIPVTNYYLNALGIHFIVVMPGTTMGQEEAGYATQKFTIKALSDTPMTEMLP